MCMIQVSLWTMAQLVESTGYVVEPYKRYPKLLEILLDFLKTEQATGIRREVGRFTLLPVLQVGQLSVTV